MTDFIDYIVSEMKSHRLSKADALALIGQFRSRAVAGAQGPVIHPLLHRNTSDLSEQRFATAFDGDEPFLRDHQVHGQKVLPGVAYLEMVRAAIEQAMPAAPPGGTVELRHVVWVQPVTVQARHELTVALFPDGQAGTGEGVGFEIYSAAGPAGDGRETIHSRGQAACIDTPRPPPLDLGALRARMRRGALAAADLYPAFEKMGISYGPSHQALVAVLRGDAELLAELRLPGAAPALSDGYVLHPGLMDAALQAPIGFVDDIAAVPERALLPFALESLRVFSACTPEMVAWLRRVPDEAAPGALARIDIDLCDRDGSVCVQMRGFTFREIAVKEEAPAVLHAVPEWEAAALNALSPTDHRPGPVQQVILCGLPDLPVDDLRALLPGAQCLALPAGGDKSLAQRYGDAALACFERVRQLLQEHAQAPVVVQVVAADTPEGAVFAGLSGLFKSAAMENPRIGGQVLLMRPDIGAAELADLLRAENTGALDSVVRHGQGTRQVLRLREQGQEQERGAEAPRPAFKPQGVYLITGGLGGLGLLFAQEILSQAADAKIVLTGRSEPTPGQRQQLQALCAQGGQVEYRSLDVTDAGAVDQLVRAILDEKKQLNGILHAAGLRSDSFILKKTAEQFGRVLEPKVAGTLNLDRATREVDLDFMVLFSSGAAVMGNAGQADYAAANGFMDGFAGYRSSLVARGQRRGKTLSINWPLWQDGGMGVEVEIQAHLQELSGMVPMQTATGMQAFHRALALDGHQLLLVEGDPAKLRRTLFAGGVSHRVEPPVPAGASPAGPGTTGLREAVQAFLKRTLSALLRLPSSRIDAQAPFEKYGIDSIMTMNLTQALEKTFGALPKTLFFEYRSIAELAEYFTRSHPQQVAQLVAQTPGAAPNAAPAAVAQATPRAPSRRPAHRRHLPAPADAVGGTAANLTASRAEPIAIVGLSGRYPGAQGIEAYWRNLRDGRDCITEVPPSRWDWREFYSQDRGEAGRHYSKWGGFIDGVDEFDPRFFGISPREAALMEPQERLFLQHAWMALEDAGETRAALHRDRPGDLPGQAGVYVGVMYSEYQLFGAEALAQGRRLAVPGSYASIANRVSYLLDLHGPSMTVDTMCSSSLTAIHLACQDLKLGHTDVALAGGVNISIHPAKYLMISAGQFISSDGHCQSFGVGGDGYIPAEGVGVVVLKRLSDARRDGNPIHGVILGSAINHGGRTHGYSVPNPKAQAGVVRRALAEARIGPRQVSYVEAHGTGTKLGDPIEIAALTQAFHQDTHDTGFCLIGSAKSNIGHAESAAGIAGLTKVLLQMKHRQIAPSLHSSVLNPHIDFASTPFVVNQALRDWDRPCIDGQEGPRIAGLSSFGAGGSNAHLVVQEWDEPAPGRARIDAAEGPGVAIPLSARTPEQLEQRARDLRDFLRAAAAPIDLAAVAHTLQVGREAMDVRLGFVVRTAQELIDKLDAWCGGERDIEAAWHGEVKHGSELLSTLAVDADFQETVGRWIAHRKLPRLLELWVNGLAVDWAGLWGEDKPRCMSLPTYPFARERYWIEPVRGDQQAAAPAALGTGAEPGPEPAAKQAGTPVGKQAGKQAGVQLRDLGQVAALPPAPVARRATAPRVPVAPQHSAAQLLQQLKESLAAALYLEPGEIDPGKPFVDLGLDSIVGVEWVKAINKQYGIDLAAARVYDYPNLQELSTFVAGELAGQPAAQAPAQAPAEVPGEAPAAPAVARRPVALAPLHAAPPPASSGPSRAALQEQLRATLAAALYLDPAEIDPGKPFVDLGLDSIVGVEWVKVINKQYGLDLAATRVYDHPSLKDLAAFIAGELASAPPRDVPSDVPPDVAPPAPAIEAVAPAAPAPADPPPAPRPPAPQPTPRDVRGASGKVAIIGMSGRYPGAANLQRYWQNLAEGRNSVTEVPRSRWDVNQYYDPDPKKPGKIYCKWLGALDEVDCFDPLFFQITPAEAELMDPQHRLFLQESYRAFEDAGYAPKALGNVKCGVYLGIMSSEYAFLGYGAASAASIPVTGSSFAIGAARIAYFLNLKGPAIPIDTACSSSLVAVHLACQALLQHETDMALAGGVTTYLIPESYLGMCQAGMLSPQGQCKAFDDGANGFVPGEGVGALVLKRLEDAERDNDAIYGVILGSAINQDGKTNGITAPSVKSQIQLERDLYERCGIHPETIGYVETHGTGTKLGDPIELEALATVFKEKTAKRNFCGLGSVKSNIGHVSAAAGVASMQKVLLSMQHGSFVPSLHVEKENSLFDFDKSPFFISRTTQPWQRDGEAPRRAAVSAFGFSGTNAHLVIEEYRPRHGRPDRQIPSASPREEAILLSARTAEQLEQKARDLLECLRTNRDAPQPLELRALAHTLQMGRDAMKERLGVIVRSTEQLAAALAAHLQGQGAAAGVLRGHAQEGAPAHLGTDAARAGRLAQALDLWVRGAQPDWPTLQDDELPQCLRLPTYPFAKGSYWVAPAATPARVAEPAPAGIEPAPVALAQTLRYVPVWHPRGLDEPGEPAEPGAGPVTPGLLLVLGEGDDLVHALRTRAEGAGGAALVQARFAAAYEKIDATRFTVDPGQPEHFTRLLADLAAQGQWPRWILHSAPLQQGAAVGTGLTRGVGALFGLCKALMAGGASRAVNLVSVCNRGAGLAEPLTAALAGFYRTLALENPGLRGKVVAVDPDAATPPALGPLLWNELREPAWTHEVRYVCDARPGTASRSVKAWAEWDPEQTPDARALTEMPIRHGGVYLISGGLGGLGFIFAEHLARNYHAHLVLLGRSAPDGGHRDKLDRLRACGVDVLYQQADVANAQDVRAAIAAAKSRFPRIDGVIHAAGTTKDAFILKKTREQLDAVVHPKVLGAVHLDEATRAESLDFFVLFSSVAAVAGNTGQCDYAYANHFLDAFAGYRDGLRAQGERRGRTLSINWPYWQQGGMALSPAEVDLMRTRTGMQPMPTEQGLRCWEDLLRSPLTQGVALHGAPAQIRAQFTAKAPTGAPAAPSGAPGLDGLEGQALRDRTEAWLKALVGEVIRLAPEQIDAHERLESFGIDSIVIGRINLRLEAAIGDLPKTLFYEHETLSDLAGYLMRERHGVLQSLWRAAPAAGAPAAPCVEPGVAPVIESGPAPSAAPAPGTAEPIAIIGQHGLYPKSPDLEAFWAHLRNGHDLVDPVPASRWDCEDHFDPDPERAADGKIYCKWGGFLEDFDRFDAGFFHMPAAEAKVVDPQERLFLQSVWSALEDAGYTRERLKKQHPRAKSAAVGVFVGVTTNTYQSLGVEASVDGRHINAASLPWSIANRVSYFLDLQGPSMAVDTACSSSLVALHLACESLMRGDCELAIAGGVNLYLHPSKYQSFCERRMVSGDGRTHSFGAGEEGFVPAEGVGTLVLKPLSRAIADGDSICAVVRASGWTHSGRANGYSAPNPNSNATLISETLRKAGIPADSIGYVEGHGTGTQLGDSLEIVALTNAFRAQTARTQFCAIGSVKSNIGHPEAAAGVAGIAKILLQFRHQELVPTLHSEPANPDIDFAASPFYLQHALTRWDASPDHPRRALINSFGSGGVAACVVLEEGGLAPVPAADSAQDPGPWLFVLSARDTERLRDYAERMLAHLEMHGDMALANLCHTLQTGREAMAERLAIVATGREQLADSLRRASRGEAAPGVHRGGPALVRVANPPGLDQALASADLEALAVAWVGGAHVHWTALRRPAWPRRISLPTYPFAKDRHWAFDAPAGKRPALPAATQSLHTDAATQSLHTDAATQSLHPLIGHNASTLTEVSFRSCLSDRAYYAQEHRVRGQKLFPGSAFVEMACIAGTLVGGAKVAKIQDIVWALPLSLERGGRTAQIALTPLGHDDAEFVITSCGEDGEPVVHSEGKLCFQAGAKEPVAIDERLDIRALKQACTRQLRPDEYYALTQKYGFDYGPAFRTITELHLAGSYALSRLALADHVRADFEQYILHPCLLDGALQTASALITGLERPTPCIPFAIGEVEIFRAIPESCYVHVERAAGHESETADVLKFNIRIVTEGGHEVVRIRDFCVRAFVAAAGVASAPVLAQP